MRVPGSEGARVASSLFIIGCQGHVFIIRVWAEFFFNCRRERRASSNCLFDDEVGPDCVPRRRNVYIYIDGLTIIVYI
jgi:hypothetical protein